MLTETMMCIPLYDDMASVIFELYENKDERSPYALFIVGIDDNEAYVFTTKEHIALNKKGASYRDWVKKNPNKNIDGLQRHILHHELYITSYPQSDFKQLDDNFFFNENLFNIPNMEMQFTWSVCRNRVYVVVYRDKELKGGMVPLMESVCEEAVIAWREYLNDKPYNTLPPRIDVNKIIESQHEFKETASFFSTVTKISSLFYETARSKGSISVMRDKCKDNRLIQLKTDTEIETLAFSIKYAKQLRKLLEITNNDLSLLIYDNKVYGIGVPDPLKTVCTFNLTGHMEWHILDHGEEKEGIQVLRYKHGKYYLPASPEIRDWYIDSKIEDFNVREIIKDLIGRDEMRKFDHGALLILTSKAEKEVERLCRLKRGFSTEPINMKTNFENAYALCTIDGALFLDRDGNCHGIGVILDGEAISEGTPARGARYNSAKTYISRCVVEGYKAYALVVSSDGYLDILTTYDKEYKKLKKRSHIKKPGKKHMEKKKRRIHKRRGVNETKTK